MIKIAHLSLTCLIAVSIATQSVAASGVSCRKPDEQAVLRDIEAKGDAVIFTYSPSELYDDRSIEYVNCRTNAALSVDIENQRYYDDVARDLIRTAIDSPAPYTRQDLINAFERRSIVAKPGKLDNTICACWDKVQKKARRKWGK